MASQPLAFAELLAGGVLLTSAIQNKSIAQTIKGEAGKLAGASPGIESLNPSQSGGAEGGSTENPEPKINQFAPAPGHAAKSHKSEIPKIEKELENYLKRPLTKKEKQEIMAAEGNV